MTETPIRKTQGEIINTIEQLFQKLENLTPNMISNQKIPQQHKKTTDPYFLLHGERLSQEFTSAKNTERRKLYCQTYNKQERHQIFVQWTQHLNKTNTDLFLLDYMENLTTTKLRQQSKKKTTTLQPSSSKPEEQQTITNNIQDDLSIQTIKINKQTATPKTNQITVPNLYGEIKQTKRHLLKIKNSTSPNKCYCRNLPLEPQFITIQRWNTRINLKIQDMELETTALIDTGADMNCIQEGLIPTKYYHKTIEKLVSANGGQMDIQYKLPNVHICQDNVCFKTSFILVKDMTDNVILGLPFIGMIYPFTSNEKGLTTTHLGKQIIFKFLKPPEQRELKQLQLQ